MNSASDLTRNGSDDDLPSQQQLAALAAASHIKDPIKAVEHALAVWQEAGKILAAKEHALVRQRVAHVPLPKKGFPATLEDFLRVVVGAKTVADETKRLRDFYRETLCGHTTSPLPHKPHSAEDHDRDGGLTVDPEQWAADAIQDLRECGFRTEHEWLELAQHYVKWWAGRKSKSAHKSAKQGRSSS
jgi:hypothetical protein